jgi:hypothetical protein
MTAKILNLLLCFIGRELEISKTLLEQVPSLSQSAEESEIRITVVRKVLKADGWKVRGLYHLRF